MIIYFLRHGQTAWNKKGIVQGHKDSPLTLKGEKSAERKGRELVKKNIEIIYSSDLGRCVQTAKIINRWLKVKMIKKKALRERNFGDLNGYLNKSVRAKLDLSNLYEKAPSGESFYDLKERVLKFIRLLSKKDLEKILLVTHDGPTRAILSEYYQADIQSPKCNTSDKVVYCFEVNNGVIREKSLLRIKTR